MGGGAQYNTLAVKRQCENKLSIQFRGTKEYNGWFEYQGTRICRITVPMGRKPIKRGTHASMSRQLGLTVDQFDDLVQCPMKYEGYIACLRARGSPPKLSD